MPLGSNVSENIRKLYDEHSDEKAWPRKRIIAAATSAARAAGGKVPRKEKHARILGK